MKGRMKTVLLSVALAIGVGTSGASHTWGADAKPEFDVHEGVPAPPLFKEYRQPVGVGSTISQGHGGAISHTDEFNYHALDYALAIGSPIVASRSGFVSSVKMDSNIGGKSVAWIADGNEVVIDHRDGTSTIYLHLSKDATWARVGEFVLMGEQIGLSGDTGYSWSPHLHFTSAETDSRKSISCSFADFDKRGGIPRKNDLVEPAAKPAVPQKRVDQYKHGFRTSCWAEGAGYLGIAFEACRKGLKGRRVESYFYDQVLTKKEARLKGLLVARLSKLAAAESWQPSELVELYRYDRSLGKTKDKGVKAALKQALKSSKAKATLKSSARAIQDWCVGLERASSGSYREAFPKYRSAWERASEPLRQTIVASFLHLLESRGKHLRRSLTRLLEESEKVRPPQEEAVRKDASAAWKELKPMIEFWREAVPKEAAVAERHLEQCAEAFAKIQGE